MSTTKNSSRYDFSIIADWVPRGSRVLDLGCGDGELLNYLKSKKNITGFGIEKGEKNWLEALKNNIDVIQIDIESGLSEFETDSFDVVILSKTIQSMQNTEMVVKEMLRIGKEVIVTFPNFGFWRNRFQIIMGRMPISDELPYAWFNTPNIHLCTIKDFDSFCEKYRFKITDRMILTDKQSVKFIPNLFGALALYKLVSK
ncbi:MAG TPA: methionine biosynthesis protein MetW [Methylophilaceae bacterium]|jgi:methionine biosynthesis protein MetW|nr:methionine biosynthesis protein MetW [Methylophilaceae bacterium]